MVEVMVTVGSDVGVGFLDLDDVSDEDLELREQAHRIARDVLRPAASELDRMEPEARILPGSPFHEAMSQLKQLGFHRLFLAPEYSGLPTTVSAIGQAMVLEELGWGSLGLTTSFLTDMLPFVSIALFGGDRLKADVLEPWIEDVDGRFRGCWAITEPDHGSDFLSLREYAGVEIPRGQLVAERSTDGWVLRGQKSAWVSSGPVATHAALHAQCGSSGDLIHGLYAVVPLEVVGVRKGRPADMLGVRDDPQGEIYFDDVFVPDENVLISSDPFYMVFGDQLLCLTSSTLAPVAVGLARAAFEEALVHARLRVQGGRPISDHKNIQLTLYSMFEKVETARAYSRRVYEHVRRASLVGLNGESGQDSIQRGGASPRHARAAQIFTKRCAFEVAHDAVQVCGAFGLSRDSLTEKLFRDARCLMIEDGTLEVLGIDAARDLVSNYESSEYGIEEVMAQW